MRLSWATRIILCGCIILTLINGIYFYFQSKNINESGQQPSFTECMCPYIVIVLGKTHWWAFWTILTASFVQKQFISNILFFFICLTGGNYCERCWSTISYLKFSVFALSFPLFIECILSSLLFKNKLVVLNGSNGLLAGIIISLRLLIPGHTIILLRNKVRIQIRHLPFVSVIFFGLLHSLNCIENPYAFYLGVPLCWYYLRYLHRNERGEIGDASDSFSFVCLFPECIKVFIEPVFDRLHYIFVRLKLIEKFSEAEIRAANEKYAARLSGRVLPVYARSAQYTNQRRKMMLRAMGQS